MRAGAAPVAHGRRLNALWRWGSRSTFCLALVILSCSSSQPARTPPPTAGLTSDAGRVRAGLQGHWRLVTVDDREASGYVVFGRNQFNVSGGDCNSLFGEYELSGNLVVTRGVLSTMMNCTGSRGAAGRFPDFVLDRFHVWLGPSELVLVGVKRSRSRWARYRRMTPEEWEKTVSGGRARPPP